MATTSKVESACSLPAWQGDDNRLEKTFNFADFSAAARFVGRLADDAAIAGRQPAIDLRCDRVTVAFAPRGDSALTQDDVAVTSASSGSSATIVTRSVGPARGVPAEPWPASARAQSARPGPNPAGTLARREACRRRHAEPAIQFRCRAEVTMSGRPWPVGSAAQLSRVSTTQQRPGWGSSTARTVGGSPST
jgi:pterin-4a-carbinolamine dehydratase